MWPFRPKQRIREYLERDDVADAATNWYFSLKSFAKFLSRFGEEDAERVILAYRTQKAGAIHDPVEDAADHAEAFLEVEAIIRARFPELRMGQCHQIWRMKKQLLKERGISWLGPSDLNPYNRYD